MIKTKEEAKARLEEAIQIQRQMQEFLDKGGVSKEELFKQRDEWFLGILRDLRVRVIESNFVEYKNSKNEWMIQDEKSGTFWFSYYRIWDALRNKYQMQDIEIQTYLKDMLLMHLNWRVKTVYWCKNY